MRFLPLIWSGIWRKPGRSVLIFLQVSVAGTDLEEAEFREYKDNYDSERHWLICTKKGDIFEGHCGPTRLGDMLEVFLSWAERETPRRS